MMAFADLYAQMEIGIKDVVRAIVHQHEYPRYEIIRALVNDLKFPYGAAQTPERKAHNKAVDALFEAATAVVEIEEDVYSYEPANNGAGPMWCHGSTCLVRIGDDLFASGLETLAEAKPLNNCRWMLFHRKEQGWRKVCFDAHGRTREP